MPFAEVIGDPIAQSKSPIIHNHWLEQLGIEGDYIRTRVAADELPDFITRRRIDSNWRGCNVTIPHKQAIMSLLGRVDAAAAAIGAVNCVVPEDGELVGYNSDIEGVAAALDATELAGRKAAVIGAGGGARAVVSYLAQRQADIVVLARNPAKAEELRSLAPVQILPIERAAGGFQGTAAIVNATSLGMAGADPMPASLLEAVRTNSAETVLFDMVTTPQNTQFLSCGARTVDGLTMLIGQARRAFELFFGSTPPQGDAELRRLLTGADQ
jgi:shikimate dehydrogenase